MYLILKHIHLTAITLSFLVFFVRGILMMRNSTIGNSRTVLIIAHCINLILIVSGITLAVHLSYSPMEQSWLLAKLIALVIYIVLGILAFKHPNVKARKIIWLFALIVFAYIVSVAKSKLALGFLAALF